MKIDMHEILIKDLVKGYIDNDEEGVIGFGGKLNIRPKYQREFVYDDDKRDAVIDTIRKDFPLNVMYWVKNGDTFEVLDGQQRTISICQYVKGQYSINGRAWNNLTTDEQEQIESYKLMIYFCEGNDSEKNAWFKIINTAALVLTDQELLNVNYTGTWLTDAKRHFSKNNCAAHNLEKDYVSGAANRQEILETAIDWISKGEIADYMGKHQQEPNANELWLYFQKVISWVKTVFTKYRKEMKGLQWGEFYNKYEKKNYDSGKLEKEITKLMQDDDVTKKSGIYEFILSGNEKTLNIRAFSDNQKRESYERQNGKCAKCKKPFEIDEMEADHIKPWHEGGKTNAGNCQMLCKPDNRTKSGK